MDPEFDGEDEVIDEGEDGDIEDGEPVEGVTYESAPDLDDTDLGDEGNDGDGEG